MLPNYTGKAADRGPPSNPAPIPQSPPLAPRRAAEQPAFCHNPACFSFATSIHPLYGRVGRLWAAAAYGHNLALSVAAAYSGAMFRVILPIPLIFALFAAAGPAHAQPALAPQTAAAPVSDRLGSYVDIAELALASPVIIRATIVRVDRLRGEAAKGVAAGRTRLVVTAALSNVLVAPGAMAATVQYQWDAPTDARGRPPAAKGMDVIAFLAPPGDGGATRLISRRAQQPYDPALADRVRTILTEARSGEVPIVRGVSSGFRAEGTVPGESESQFFLTTADGKPATLVVQNRSGEARRVLVAQGDIIDESARRILPDSLLWYRLACFLPAALPEAAGGRDPALARDWRDAIASLGPCTRTG